MARDYRPVRRDEAMLLPPDMRDWLPPDHLVWFVITAVDQFDLDSFDAASGRGGVGRAGYDPRLLLAVLIYAYGCGVRSSREIERRCHTDVAFRVACGNDVCDHTTIARFRARHQDRFVDLFAQVLKLCGTAGLGDLSVVAVDGTKIAANASAQQNRTESWYRARAAQALAEAAAADQAEDVEHGPGNRGDRPVHDWADPSTWSQKIKETLKTVVEDLDTETERDADRARPITQAGRQRAAQRFEDCWEAAATDLNLPAPSGRWPKAADRVKISRFRLQRAQAQAEAARAARHDTPQHPAEHRDTPTRQHRVPVDHLKPVRAAAAALALAEQQASQPDPTTADAPTKERQRNLTDPDSRLMPTRKGWVQGYNCQLVTTADQIIIAVHTTQDTGDATLYTPMITTAEHNATTLAPDTPIGLVLADAGYLSDDNLTSEGPTRLIAVGKHRDQQHQARHHPTTGPPPPNSTPTQTMAWDLRNPHNAALYRRRGAIIEPVNAHLKDRNGLRRFSRRGLHAAHSELTLTATVHNLTKIWRTRPTTA